MRLHHYSHIQTSPIEPCEYIPRFHPTECMSHSIYYRMELALQVVGLKMTGKIEEAKNVAMRIVGNAGDPSDSQNGSNMTGAMQLSPSLTRDLRPLLLIRAGENEDFQSLIIDFLSILDAPYIFTVLHGILCPF